MSAEIFLLKKRLLKDIKQLKGKNEKAKFVNVLAVVEKICLCTMTLDFVLIAM
jgi:hypothetical protein